MVEPILVTGVARSGTSLTAGIINICGAFGGVMSGPNANNKKGMFENSAIRQNVVKPYLRSLGVDPMGQHPLPDLDNMNICSRLINDGFELRTKVTEVIRNQGYNGGFWFYKGAKMCLMWPLWHSAFPGARWVIVRRNAEAIARSCMKTPFMRAFKKLEDWVDWANYHEKCFYAMEFAGLDITYIWPEKTVKGDYNEMKNLIDLFGLTWNDERVRSFVAPELWES